MNDWSSASTVICIISTERHIVYAFNFISFSVSMTSSHIILSDFPVPISWKWNQSKWTEAY